jgi:hypothetical protein
MEAFLVIFGMRLLQVGPETSSNPRAPDSPSLLSLAQLSITGWHFRDARTVLRTAGATVCDVKARGRELRVVSVGVGAMSVGPLELCLWVGLVEVPGGRRGSRVGCCRTARSGARGGPAPNPCGARSAHHQRVPEVGRDSACHSPLHRSCQDHRGVECPISGGRAGYRQGGTYLAVSSIPRTFTTTRRSETVSVM